jgi:hypothetical protein
MGFLNTDLRRYPKNITDYVQACDMFPIQKFKSIWPRYWNAYKLEQIRCGVFAKSGGRGIIRLETAAKVIRDLNKALIPMACLGHRNR